MSANNKWLITVVCLFVVAAMSLSTVAWFVTLNNMVDPGISGGSIIQQYFHCGDGSENNPFVITRPIHYYHLAELYLRNPDNFATKDYYFQLGYELDGDPTNGLEVYDYDSMGYTDGSTSKVLNMDYYSGTLSLIPVGTSSYPFNGVFNGSGLTVSNLSVYSAEYVNGVLVSSNDIGIFGTVVNNEGDTVIRDTYFENVTISLNQAACAFGSIASADDQTAVHQEGNICVGTLIGHLYNYTNAQGRDYTQNTVTVNANPTSNVYLNNVTVSGGALSDAVCDYGMIGYVENTDGEKAQTIRQYVEGDQIQGDGDESWGGSIDMTELFNRVTALITGSESSSNRYYPTAETIIQSGTSSGTPSVTMTSKYDGTLRSDYGSVYYWSASRLAGLNVSADMTGGAIYGTDSGNEWNYLYGLTSAQLTTTTTITKTGAQVDAYFIFNNGYYMDFENGAVIGVKSSKDGVKLIPKNATTVGGKTTARYYILVDSTEYYLKANGTSNVSFVTGESNASTWTTNDSGEFYVTVGGNNYYLHYDGAWSLSLSSTRYAISDGTHYLTATVDGVDTTTDSGRGYVWQVNQNTSAKTYSFYFISSGKEHYLYINNGELAVVESDGSSAYTWNYGASDEGDGMTLSTTINGITYYLCYNEGWRATINGHTLSVDVDGSRQYMRVVFEDGVPTIGVTSSSANASVFQIKKASDGTYTLAVPINGTAYYLTSVGEKVTLTDTAVYWTRGGSSPSYSFTREVTYTGDAANLSNLYYITYKNGWIVSPLTGFYFAYKYTYNGVSTTHYLALNNDGKIYDTTVATDAAIWQFPISKDTSTEKSKSVSSAVVTLMGETPYYLQVGEEGLYVDTVSVSPAKWSIVTNFETDEDTGKISISTFYVRVTKTYKTTDYFYLCCYAQTVDASGNAVTLQNPTWGIYHFAGSSKSVEYSNGLFRDTSKAHYLTYNPKSKTVVGSTTNYLVSDGDWDSAVTWMVKHTGVTGDDGLPEVVIYTYIGLNRYFLSVIDGSLCLSTAESKWFKTTNLGGSGNTGYSTGGYYLSFEGNRWTLVDLTAAVKLNYIDGNNANHYLYTNGTRVGVTAQASTANNWVYSSVTHDLATNIGTTKYYLSFENQTVKVKASDESDSVIDAYRKIVPTVTTVKPSFSWSVDDGGHYYFTLSGVRFYLYFDEKNYAWAFEEVGGYQIKQDDTYLTLKEYPDSLSASTITFSIGSLCRSNTPNYQWHIVNNRLFTIIGGTAYYLNYNESNTAAQLVTVSTTASGGQFTKNGTSLTQVIANVAMAFSYVDDGIVLPSEYTRLEYLESRANRYFDTGVVDAANVTIDCEMSFPCNRSSILFGSKSSTGDWLSNGLFVGSTNFHMEIGYSSYNQVATSSVTSGTEYHVRLSEYLYKSANDGKKHLESILTYYSDSTSGELTAYPLVEGKQEMGGNILIFGGLRYMSNKYNQVYFGTGAKLYRFRIERNNVALRDFIPVVRSDGAYGLYDLVEGKFYGEIFASAVESADLSKEDVASIEEAGYNVVSFVESTTATGALDTGIADSQTVTIDCDVEAPFGKAQYLFGSTQQNGWMYNGLYSYNNSTPNTMLLEFAYGEALTTSQTAVHMTQVLSGSQVTVTINGSLTGTYSVGSKTPGGNIYIFGCNAGGRDFGDGMKVYRFTIKNNGTVVRDYVPVQRQSDGTYGLYDRIAGGFLAVASADSYTANAPLDVDQLHKINNNGYRVVSYIESTDSTFIDTGVADSTGVTINCEIQGVAGRSKYLFASKQGSNSYGNNSIWSGIGGTFEQEVAYVTGVTTTESRIKMVQYIENGKIYTSFNGGTVGSVALTTSAIAGNITIFGYVDKNNYRQYIGSGMKVYRFTITKDGVTVRDFVPVVDVNGNAGLFDLVQSVFYGDIKPESDKLMGEGASRFYMIPSNGYYSIRYNDAYLKLNSDLSTGSATKNNASFYEYQQFIVTVSSGKYTIRLGNSSYYLTTAGALGQGSTFKQKGALTKTTDSTKAVWYKDGNKYYQNVGSEKYYLDYTDADGWFTSPSLVTLPFRYILSNGQYLALNSSKNGITSTTTYDTTNAYIRWFIDGTKVYAEINNTKYYLTWSATSGFGISTSSGTAFTIGTNTVSVKDSASSLTMNLVYDASGWNFVAVGGSHISSNSKYINMSGASALSVGSSAVTRWITNNGRVYAYWNGVIKYWNTNGSTLTLSSTGASWTVTSGQYSTTYNGVKYYVYLNDSSIVMTGPKGYYIYTLILPTNNNGPDHDYLIRESNTATAPKQKNTSSATESEALWQFDNGNIYFTYTSGSTTKYGYLTYYNTTAPASSGSGTSFYIGSSTNSVVWSYNASTHRLSMTKGSITGYVALRIANNSIQGWKLYANDTSDSIKKSDNKTTGNYFDVYMDPVYNTSLITTFTSTANSSTENNLYTDSYVTGMEPQDLTTAHSTEPAYVFFGDASAKPSAVPDAEVQEARTTTNLTATSFKQGKRTMTYSRCSKTFTRTKLTLTTYTSKPVAVTILSTQANPTVLMIKDKERLYETTVTTYKRGTYLPIKSSYTDEDETTYTSDYHAGNRNTGYIVGGSYSDPSGSGQGDIRVSEYSSGNISDSYNRSYGTFTNLYTFNDAGGTTPVLINDSANAYVNYEYTKSKFLEILSQNRSYVYGLHFMDSAISTDHIMTAESVRILGKTYVNYQLPESCIDFNVYEQGQIVLYAGDYYGGNSCFFSLHKVFRDANNQITAIKEISEIYTKTDIKAYQYYIYKFTDGTYTNQKGEYVNAQLTTAIVRDLGYQTTPVFKMSWLTNPSGGKSFSNDYIYYFEIPCNKGEYALGSVEGQDGGYLLYLDIATNGVHGTTFNQRAGIYDDPLLTQIGYRSVNDPLVINSLLNIAYQLPDGNTEDNFRITVSYDSTDKVHDEKYGLSGVGLTCTVFTIEVTNTTGNGMDLYVLLLDDDDDPSNDYPYRYRVIYNGSVFTDSTAYDPDVGAFYATTSISLAPYTGS